MFDNSTRTRLLIPGLAGFYAWAEPIGYALMRFTIGIIIFVHGYMKVAGPGPAGVTGMFTRMAFPAPGAMAYLAIFVETIGTLCVALGLFTRFFSAALAIQMLVILITAHWAKGFNVGAGGYEYVLLLGMVYFYIAPRGGGRYSLDAKLGKEL
ncbi:MAG: DoxX family protein [Pseudolabrys sp.]|nr:DoxX family protein [Pseudolabrys sp.]